MAKYTITYFGVAARAEALRLTLEVSGANWEDVRITGDKWKPMKAEVEAANQKGEAFRFPWLPHVKLEEGGSEVIVSQSIPALRFLGRKLGLDGGSDAEKVMVDSILDLYVDFFKGYTPIFFSKTPDTAAEEFAKVFDTTGKYLETILSSSKSGYLVGSKITVADVAIFSVLKQAVLTVESKSSQKVDFSKFPKLKAHHDKIAAEPKIKAYYSK